MRRQSCLTILTAAIASKYFDEGKNTPLKRHYKVLLEFRLHLHSSKTCLFPF